MTEFVSACPRSIRFSPVRRALLAGLASAGAVALSGCGSMKTTGDSGGASAAGSRYLADIRRAHGLAGLSPDRRLEQAALEQSAFMARYARMAHDTGSGRDFATRMKRYRIGTAAENLAHGRFGMDRLFAMWMASSGHRANMLNPDFGRFGLAYSYDADGERRYWALILAR